MKRLAIPVLFLTVLFSIGAHAQEDPFEPVVKALKEADSRSLASLFNVSVELSLPDIENTYSVTQAEMIMKDFFKKYPPEELALIQKGVINPMSHFAIYSYKSSNSWFRVYCDLRKEKDRFLIYKLKFEDSKSNLR